MTIIYALLLKHNKIYIGKTNNLNKRLQEHVNKNGSGWTKKFDVIKILDSFYSKNPTEETKLTLQYMKIYGVNNVRGGAISQTDKLNEIEINLIHKLMYYKTLYINSSAEIIIFNQYLFHDKNVCVRCGFPGHFQKNCFSKKTINGYDLKDIENNKYSSYFQKLKNPWI